METFISLDHAILTKHLKHCWVALIQLRATSHRITTKQSLVATKLSSTALSISHLWDLTRHCFRIPTTFSGKMQSLKRHISDKDKIIQALPLGMLMVTVANVFGFSIKKGKTII